MFKLCELIITSDVDNIVSWLACWCRARFVLYRIKNNSGVNTERDDFLSRTVSVP